MAGTPGVDTNTAIMRATANDAANTADQLAAAVKRLDSEMRATLAPWKGAAPLAYWPGHDEHVAIVTKLAASLHVMSQGISTTGVNYESTDDTNRGEHAAVTAAMSGVNLNVL